MLRSKSWFLLTVCFTLGVTAAPGWALTRVAPSTQLADATAGPSTGGGDTPYLSAEPGKTLQSPTGPAAPPAAAPAAAQTPPSEPSRPAEAKTPAPPSPSMPVEAQTPQKAPDTQSPPAPFEAATPPKPVTPSVSPPAAAEAKPEPVTPPATPAKATVPLPATPTTSEPTQQATPPVQATAPTPVNPQPQRTPAATAEPSPTPPAQAVAPTKPKQLAKKKSKPEHRPDVIVRSVPRGTYRPAADGEVAIYDDGPVPPLPIGRPHRVIVQSDDDAGDYVVVRRYRRVTSCEPHWVPGFWFLHRELHCD